MRSQWVTLVSVTLNQHGLGLYELLSDNTLTLTPPVVLAVHIKKRTSVEERPLEQALVMTRPP